MTLRRLCAAIAVTLLPLAALGSEAARGATGPRPTLLGSQIAPLGRLPASFSGDLPCADCAVLRYHLNLFADGSYFLGTEYVGRKDGTFYDIGKWSVSADRRTLTLRGGREAPEFLRIVDASSLRKLGLDGRDIDSTLDYSLKRTAQFEPLEPRLLMRGLYTAAADAGTLTECLTGQRWPVAASADQAALALAVRNARQAPGDPLLVNLEGQVKRLPRTDGKGTLSTLVVERFIRAWPGESCAPRGAAGLTDVTWALTEVDGQAITSAPRPTLRLDSPGSQVAGFSGCNRLRGSYTLSGAELAFGLLAGTMRACTEGMEVEKAFLEMLARVSSWRLSGARLELIDARGIVLARFDVLPAR